MSEWQDIAGADTYFTTRAGASGWSALTDKQSLLTTAYNRIYYHPDYDIPSSPSISQLAKLKIAQSELAWYMHIHIEDEDRRKGLQAQGVIDAGIVKEKYNTEDLANLPLPAFVVKLLNGFNNVEPFYAGDLARDENYTVDSDTPLSEQDLDT